MLLCSFKYFKFKSKCFYTYCDKQKCYVFFTWPMANYNKYFVFSQPVEMEADKQNKTKNNQTKKSTIFVK